MSILVTGGAGFIGSHLVERLLDETTARIVCLDNFNDFYSPAAKRANVAGFASNDRIDLVEGDVCESAAMRALFDRHDVEQVVHLAAYAGVRISIERPEIYVRTNIGGTLAMLEAARRHPVDRLVMISSSTVYGADVVAPFTEDAPLGIPLSPYGTTKRAAELLCQTYRRLHQVPIVCLRPFSVYGLRLRPDLALSIFATAIEEGRPLPLFGDGSAQRDFTHVSDICEGIVAALSAKGVVGEAINLGHHEPIEIRTLISLLSEMMGREPKIEHHDANPANMAATHADLTKAARLLGISRRCLLKKDCANTWPCFALSSRRSCM